MLRCIFLYTCHRNEAFAKITLCYSFYTNLMRSIFIRLNRKDILQNVQTLILDGLPGTSDLCYEIINTDGYNVRFLSLRDSAILNEGKLQGALQFACRPSRPDGKPKLKGVYIFSDRETEEVQSPNASLSDSTQQKPATPWGNEDSWWSDNRKGQVIRRSVSTDWACILQVCEGIIAFDAVLCKGPRHSNSPVYGKAAYLNPETPNIPAVATYALKGCAGCGSAPEGATTSSQSPFQKPLLSPPSIHASTMAAATCPQKASDSFVPRCKDCLWERWCKNCNEWWCEDCYSKAGEALRHSTSPASSMVSLQEAKDRKPNMDIKVWAQKCAKCYGMPSLEYQGSMLDWLLEWLPI